MHAFTRKIRLVAALFALAPIPVAAQDRASPLPAHLPLGQEACFGRSYDSKHLAAHPGQRVTSFHLFRNFTPDPDTETPARSAQETIAQDGDGGVWVAAYIRLRDRKGVFRSNLQCGSGGSCSIECDGGGFRLKPGGASLLVENDGFVVSGGCGSDEDDDSRADFVKPGSDDKTFRLDPMPLAACRAIEDERKPAWAKLGPPIRESLAREGAVCFARSYDEAHLARHPQQTVRRIAVLKAEDVGPGADDHPAYELTFRAELKDGRRIEKKTTCSADNYAFSCTHDPAMDTAREFILRRAGSDGVILRDRTGKLNDLFGARLGADDRTFRMQGAPAAACNF